MRTEMEVERNGLTTYEPIFLEARPTPVKGEDIERAYHTTNEFEKASFDAAVKSFDAKLNSLSKDCKNKIDSKALKNYEFVKKLVK